ncbi:MAG: hypothetical protein ACF8QF_08495 [Phycisphaerales bacterium]
MSDDLLADVIGSRTTARTTAAKRGLTLRELARWASDAENRAAMAALQELADAQAGLVISRARAEAARRLLLIAKNKDAPETARKACVDLLGLAGSGRPDAGSEDASALHAEIRAFLESAGAPDSKERGLA